MTSERVSAFRNILRLEERRGFDNRAVMGGMDAFLERWRKELESSTAPADVALMWRLKNAGVFSVAYASVPQEARKRWAALAVRALEGSGRPSADFADSTDLKRAATNVHAESRAATGRDQDKRPLPTPSPARGGQTVDGGPGHERGKRPLPPIPSPARRKGEDAAAQAGPLPPVATRISTSPLASLKGKPATGEGTPAALAITAPVTRVRGVGPNVAEKLKALGIETVRDLLYHLPRRHLTPVRVADLKGVGEEAVVGTVWEARTVRLGARATLSTQAVIGDDSGNIRVVWFNQKYVAQTLKTNDRVLVHGYLREYRGMPTLEPAGYERLEPDDANFQVGKPFPVYPSTEGLSQRMLRRCVRAALDGWLASVEESLPDGLLSRLGMPRRAVALEEYHYPRDSAGLERARRRLAFDELLVAQLAMLKRKREWQEAGSGIVLRPPTGVIETFVKSLPFQLTQAQQRALDAVFADMARNVPMGRLLQGDVGSGKTVVALAAMLGAAACGYQSALMAPTEILAEQHFLTVSRLLQGLARPVLDPNLVTVYLDPHPQPISVGLLLGSMSKRAKAEQVKRAAAGALDVIIGTHAVIQEDVSLPRLALAVVDEQHRFGVEQRAALRAKGERPHLLAMSATPIPRSLALTLYGDLDLTVLDGMPPGRQPVRTRWLRPDQREQAHEFIRNQVREGRQAFVICPLITESEAKQSRAAEEEYRKLSTEVFPDLRVALLHGRMPLREKAEVMERFRAREADVLVATPVIEVGVDIPNATAIMIESADRFGLAELHQFRGRVGRGEFPGYCMLMADEPSAEAQERLSLLERESDGFKVAEEDLRLRGQGEVLGTRQSGLPEMRVARLSDQEMVLLARGEAQRLLERDPELRGPEVAVLAKELAAVLAKAGDGAVVG